MDDARLNRLLKRIAPTRLDELGTDFASIVVARLQDRRPEFSKGSLFLAAALVLLTSVGVGLSAVRFHHHAWQADEPPRLAVFDTRGSFEPW